MTQTQKENLIVGTIACAVLALAVYFAVFGFVAPKDEYVPLSVKWVTTSRHYVYEYVYQGMREERDKDGKVTSRYPDWDWEWVHKHDTEKTGHDFDWSWPHVEKEKTFFASAGQTAIVNYGPDFYVSGVWIGTDAQRFREFDDPELKQVKIHTNRYGLQYVTPHRLEAKEQP